MTPSGGSVGIGFAIPSNMAQKVVADLKSKGKVVRGFVGIQMLQMTAEQAKEEIDINEVGCFITKVESNSPAQRGGLKRNDYIVAVNGKKIENGNQLSLAIANTSPGDTVELSLYRGNDKKTIKIKVEEAPENMRVRSQNADANSTDLGMVVVNNSAAIAREMELKTRDGIVVQRIDRGGLAQRNNLRVGDFILSVARTEITSVEQFEKLMSGKRPGSAAIILINRDGEEGNIRFVIPEE